MALRKITAADVEGTHLSATHSKAVEKFNELLDTLGDVNGLLEESGAADLISGLSGVLDRTIDNSNLASGTGDIAAGDTSVAIDLGTNTFDGKFAIVSFAADPLASSKVWAGAVAAGILTINVDVAPGGAGTKVAYIVVNVPA